MKIDNKPVFFVYHNYLIENIDEFYTIANKICIENNFNGIYLVLNSLASKNENYKKFYINFNYKMYESRFTDKDNQIKLDYKEYTNNPYHLNEKTIQTIVYDFNNRPRLFIPDRLKFSTVCVNNSEFDKILFTKKLIETYNYKNKSDIDNILLINSLNEWGENMTFEPSDKCSYYNINLLMNCLIEY